MTRTQWQSDKAKMVEGVRVVTCGLVLALVACGDDGTGAIEREGAGPTNDLPLWVPAPGTFPEDTTAGGGRGHWAISEERTVDGKRIFLAGNPGPTQFLETSYGPAEPYFVRMYSRMPDGIYQVGDTRFGMYDNPVLLVPDKVRVGMRWTGAPFGTQRYTFEIVERSEYAHSEGVTWYLEVTDSERLTFRSLMDVYQGETMTMLFIEGSALGPFAARPEFGSTDVGFAWPFTPAPPGPDLTALQAVSLTPLYGGKPLFVAPDGLVPSFFGLVRDPAHPDQIGFTIEGIGTAYQNGGGGLPSMFLTGTASFCGTIEGPTGDISSVTADGSCQSARGTIIDAAGTVRRIAHDGWVRSFECDKIRGCGFIELFQLAGIGRRLDGSAAVFRAPYLGQPDLFVAPHPGDPGGRPLQANDELPNQTYIGVVPDAQGLWLSEEDATGWTHLIVQGVGRLRSVHITPTGAIDADTTLLDVGGGFGLTVDTAGRHFLRTQADGTVERLTWDSAGVHRVGVARIKVPAKHAAVGAVVDGNRLIVFTLTGFEGTDTQYDRALGWKDPDQQPGLGSVFMWEGVLP